MLQAQLVWAIQGEKDKILKLEEQRGWEGQMHAEVDTYKLT